MTVTSKSFKKGGAIPVTYTGFAEDISPSFSIEGLPEQTKTIAISLDDLDVPFCKIYNHWIIFNMPPVSEIPENIPAGKIIEKPFHAQQGTGYGKNCYRGPKPPPFLRKAHRYVFTVYALSKEISLTSICSKNEFVLAAKNFILDKASIICLYKR